MRSNTCTYVCNNFVISIYYLLIKVLKVMPKIDETKKRKRDETESSTKKIKMDKVCALLFNSH